MLPTITTLDQSVFFFINTLPHSEIIDELFLFFSFYPLIIWTLIGIIVTIVEERKEKLFIVRLFMALILSGALASGLLKPIIKRPRPDISHGSQVINVSEKPAILPLSNDFAFPSGHAAIAFAGAYIVTREETIGTHAKKHSKKRNQMAQVLFLLFAITTAFSRIYLGKHYPSDVIVGSLLGWTVGWATWKMIDWVKIMVGKTRLSL